ncbi:MAG TPA: DUF3352 domain-containing protein [Coleofasciculaceae cyanobacterium]|jgi:hypothetical protein
MNRSFLRILVGGAAAFLLVTIVSLIFIACQSSISLLTGGVNTFPQATAFVPKQAPAVVSGLVNPEKLYGIRQVTLPLKNRQSDRQEWQQWTTNLVSRIGLDYQKDLQPWLGDEITLAITALDFDRNLDNGMQPGYLLAVETRNNQLSQKSLSNFYEGAYKQNDASMEKYKGAKILFPPATKTKNKPIWASSVVGNFVLFANHPQIIKEAINQAQAVNLNLQQSDDYQKVISSIDRPHIGIAYIDVAKTSAWLNKSVAREKFKDNQILSAFLSISHSNLAVQTALTKVADSVASSQAYKSLINNSELNQIIDSLFVKRNTYIDLTEKTSLLEKQMPLYEVTRLAIKALFPHLKAIAIENQNNRDNVSRAEILFKLAA